MSKNVKLTQILYGLFGSGNMEGFLKLLSEKIEWSVRGPSKIPYAGEFQGRSEVLRFFQLLTSAVDILEFQTVEFLDAGDRVIVLGFEKLRAKSTGRETVNRWAHLFRIQDGQVTHFEEYIDSFAVAGIFD